MTAVPTYHSRSDRAILVQRVSGSWAGPYYLPGVAGAVSYTHLYGNYPGMTQLSAVSPDGQRSFQLISTMSYYQTDSIFNSCLLYTSRCV